MKKRTFVILIVTVSIIAIFAIIYTLVSTENYLYGSIDGKFKHAEKTLKYGDFNIKTFIDYSSKNNPVIVFIPNPASGFYPLIRNFYGDLAREFTLITFDFPFSASSYNKNKHIAEDNGASNNNIISDELLVGSLAKVVSYSKGRFPGQKVFFLGYRVGASIALMYSYVASRNDELTKLRVDGQILVATQIEQVDKDTGKIYAMLEIAKSQADERGMEFFENILKKIDNTGYESLDENEKQKISQYENVMLKDKKPGFSDEFNKVLYQVFENNSKYYNDDYTKGIANYQNYFVNPDVLYSCNFFDIPTIFIHGMKDYLSPISKIRSYYLQIETSYKNFYFDEDMDHWILFSKKDFIVSALDDLIKNSIEAYGN